MEYTHQDYLSISELKKLNSQTKKVPITLIDDEVVLDSTRILERFDAIYPERPLFSQDTKIRTFQRMLEDWSDESFYWHMQAFRWCDKNAHRSVKENSIYVPLPIRMFAGPILTKLVGNQPKSQGLGRLKYGELVQNLKDRLDDLVALLGDDPFFYSDSPSAADFAIFGVMCTGNYGATPDFEEEIVRKPELVAWRERMKQAIEH